MLHILRRPGLACLLLLATISCVPAAASAATYYVRPGGSDAASGLTLTAAWGTIAKANATVRAGDVVLVSDGTYSHFPQPAAAGTATARIRFVGNLLNPAAVVINSTSTALTSPWVTVAGFDLRYGFAVRGHGDSIAWCRAGGSSSRISGADDATVTRSVIQSKRFWVVGSENDTLTRSERCHVTDNEMVLSPDDLGGHTMRLAVLDALTFQRNRIRIRIASNAVGASATKLFHVRNSRFEDNHWDIANACLGGCDEAGWFVNRDFTRNNAWVRDTILLQGPGATQFFASCSGTYPGTVMGNTYDHCVIKQIGPSAYGAAFFYQDQAKWDRVTHNVIVGAGTAFKFNVAAHGPTVVEHNTIASFAPTLGVVDFGSTTWSGAVAFRHNILYGNPRGLRGSRAVPLSANVNAVVGRLVSNRNLFFGAVARDSAVMASPVGPSPVGLGTRWNVNAYADSNSWHGSPLFMDSTSVASFDARLRPGSAAAGRALDGSDLGVSFAAPDQVAPAAVGDLAATLIRDRSVVLAWTATGDDGTAGQAARTLVRWSTAPITAANFDQANDASPMSAPLPAGSRESWEVAGLANTTTYYFAIVVVDESGLRSPISNVIVATTRVDETAPGAVSDLTIR